MQRVVPTSFVVPMVSASQRVSDVTAAETVLTTATSQTAVSSCNVSECIAWCEGCKVVGRFMLFL